MFEDLIHKSYPCKALSKEFIIYVDFKLEQIHAPYMEMQRVISTDLVCKIGLKTLDSSITFTLRQQYY